MTQPTVRRATAADLDALAVLFDGYRQFYECPADLAAARDYLHARMSNDESTIFVAEGDGGALIGFTQLYPTFCSVEAGPIFVLYDLFVSADARTRGTGRALMQEAERFARAAGAIRMDLSTAKTNTTAQALYESLGWVRDDLFYPYSRSLTA